MPPKNTERLTLRQQLENREKESFQFLNRLPIERKYVLIGGYAVSSYNFPRYSVDLDLLVPEEEASFIQSLAKNLGYTRTPGKRQIEPQYKGWSEGFVKSMGLDVGIDLLVNSVQSRDTGCAYSFQYILAHSETRQIRGRGLEARATARVADREMLIALKAQPMREQDIGDILALCYQKPNPDLVVAHLKKCPRPKIQHNLAKLQGFVADPKVHSVRGPFSLGQREFDQSLENCRRLLTVLQRELG